ncbi:hypothetical protein LAZ67_18001103 [Cordylochernes scorpioides]|uniref:Reverse transcriptase domain-containing protein n=1 Tax=Cordylochernes scorpioides TaxID=51811 RepID=A0ABY6LFI4_9ARAC|nr:hypothetical protein LAZ67_18001103 [Cordylochernes scorpioides]
MVVLLTSGTKSQSFRTVTRRSSSIAASTLAMVSSETDGRPARGPLAGDTRGSSITDGCSAKTKLTSDVSLVGNWSGENKLRARAVGSSLKAILMTVVPRGTYLTDNPPYFQIPIAEEDQEKTVIITPFGLFEFNVMCFGLRNAPATFQRFMHEVLRDLTIAFSYLDDILIASTDEKQHKEHLNLVFKRINEY